MGKLVFLLVCPKITQNLWADLCWPLELARSF